MQYTPRETNSRDPDELLYNSLQPVIRGMGMTLLELSVFRQKGRGGVPGDVKIRIVVYRDGIIGTDDCSRVHRGIMPRLELAFPGADIYLEVSSPGIDRLIKDGSEFVNYIGKAVRCYRTDISDWTEGILLAADEKEVKLRGEAEEITIPYEVIAKARLNNALSSISPAQKGAGK